MDTKKHNHTPNVDHSGHRYRMKERFLHEGLDAFNDHQVLELLLFYGIPYRDTNGLAHQLLTKYGSLSGVFNADFFELKKTKSLGSHAAFLIRMMPSLARRYAMDRWDKRIQITDSRAGAKYAASLFIGFEYETFYMICLDSQNQVITPVQISKGTINETTIYPRVVIEDALRHKTAVVILAHNHPGGSTEPSPADIDMTKKLIKALSVISVRVMDHLIISGESYTSLAEHKLI